MCIANRSYFKAQCFNLNNVYIVNETSLLFNIKKHSKKAKGLLEHAWNCDSGCSLKWFFT